MRKNTLLIFVLALFAISIFIKPVFSDIIIYEDGTVNITNWTGDWNQTIYQYTTNQTIINQSFSTQVSVLTWDVGIAILLGIITLIFGFLAVKVDKKHAPLQFLFLFLSIFTIWLGSSIAIEMANLNNATGIAGMIGGGYQIYIWGGIFAIGYFLIMLVYYAFARRKEEEEEGEED